MKKTLLTACASLAIVGTAIPSSAQFHGLIFSYASFDVSASVGRLLSTAVKYFLSDDTDIVAELVWDDESACKGGCGGCYGGSGTADSIGTLAATLAEISIDPDAYGSETAVSQMHVGELAKKRMETIVQERATLDELKHDELVNAYRSQRRAIQALADALVIKKAYASLKGVAESLPGDYSGYSAAASSIATRRIVLDQLLGLKKRVIAARLRVQGETLEVESIDRGSLTTVPSI